MIENDPLNSRLYQIIGPMFIFTFLLAAYTALNTQFQSESIVTLFIGITLLLITIGGTIILYIQASLRARNLEDRRERAMHNDPSLLAREQPVPDDVILPIPFTIKSRFKPSIFLLIISVLFAAYLLFFVGIAMGGWQKIAAYNEFLAALSIPFAFVLFILVIVFIVIWRMGADQIFVTEIGISRSNSSWYSRYTIMRWDEMRVFTIIGSNKPGHVQVYELANSEKVLRFARLPCKSLSSSYKPTISYNEYDQQMRALLNLIAAKTSLSLYDLRTLHPPFFIN